MLTAFFVFVAEEWVLFTLLGVLLAVWIGYESSLGGMIISTTRLTQMLNGGDAMLIDVRLKAEYQEGSISSSHNIPYADLAKSVDSLDADKNKPVIVVCKNGLQSGGAARILRAGGYTQVLRLRGGVAEWRQENLPLLS